MYKYFLLTLFGVCNVLIASAAKADNTPPPCLPIPTRNQVSWQQMGTYAFIHFGPNTFNNMEWGYGNSDPASFNPTNLDCEQWVRTLKGGGMKGVILTCKHHDGFCLWPSKYTDYSIARSPYKNGKGDIVRELSDACRKYGLKFGVYLSPWDRHQSSYSRPEYVDYYYNQLRELLTNYGPIFELWLDGANGGDGWYGGAKEKRTIDHRTYYDFQRAYDMVKELQPQAIIFSDGGPGCRWVGNEKGVAGTTNWSFLREGVVYAGYPNYKELTTGHADGDIWVPAECDVSIRPGWFYHSNENIAVKTPGQLVDLYYKSVGRNATLLLNIPADRKGLLGQTDSLNLLEFRKRIDQDFAHNLLTDATITCSNTRGKAYKANSLTDNDYNTYWATANNVIKADINIAFNKPTRLNRLLLQEYIPLGQRVKAFSIEYKYNGNWRPLLLTEETTTIGFKRLLRFADIETSALRIRFIDARACLCISEIGAFYAESEEPLYKDASQPVAVRVADLLQRMTLKEKIGQLRCLMAWECYENNAGTLQITDKFKKILKDEHVGMFWATFRADPWTKKSLSNGLNPKTAAILANTLQRYVLENTRLGIPILLAEEAPHGHMAIGTTVFPTGLGMAATWNPALMEQIGYATAKELTLQGAHISYGPILDLARDPRWSRVEETFGEDPALVGTMGSALIRGLKRGGSLPTLKHFIAYGASQGGQNSGAVNIGKRDLLTNFLPPIYQAITAGVASVMTSYNSLDGVPCTSDRSLLTDLLRKEWKFEGIVVSDLFSIDGLHGTHRIAPTLQAAAAAALNAGVDVDLGAAAYNTLEKALADSITNMAAIDTAVARVLRMKFEKGLFEHPYVDIDMAAKQVRTAENIALAHKAAAQSITLLENRNGILPLKKNIKVAVIGPNADNRYNQLGDYTAPQEEGNIRTVLDGIRAKIGKKNVFYAKGCAVRDSTDYDFKTAIKMARQADVVIAVVGGSSARDFRTNYEATGAASVGKSISDMESGEGYDRATLTLLGRQNELLEVLKATGKPLVVAYIEGRPLDKTWGAAHADALLTAYYPGQEGGNAITAVLFGDENPAGRLPITVPVSTAQLPVYYNKLRPAAHNYVDMTAKPLYAFGYGLSYTTFEYSHLNIVPAGNGDYEVSFNITNSGSKDGEEVAQLYLSHEYSPVVMPEKQLKNFCRVMIKAGTTNTVKLTVSADDLKIIGQTMQETTDAGTVNVLIGSSSDNIKLSGKIEK